MCFPRSRSSSAASPALARATKARARKSGCARSISAASRRTSAGEKKLLRSAMPRRPRRRRSYDILSAMKLPFQPPLEPMLAKAADGLPPGDGWLFEPKWDGFRTIVWKDGAELLIQSRDEKPMNRYFPELLGPL